MVAEVSTKYTPDHVTNTGRYECERDLKRVEVIRLAAVYEGDGGGDCKEAAKAT